MRQVAGSGRRASVAFVTVRTQCRSVWRPGSGRQHRLEGSARPTLASGRSHAPTRPCRRRRPRRERSRLAAGTARRARGAARDAARARDRGAPDRPARRAGLLQLVPLRRCHGQCRGPAARGDAPAGLADPGHGRPAQAAGGRGAGGRPGGVRRGGDRSARGGAAGHHRARGGAGPATPGLGPGHRRHRAPHLAGPGRGHPPGRRRGSARLLRRDRPHRPPGLDRPGGRLVPVALRQGGAGRRHGRLHQLPDGPGAVRRLPGRPVGGRQGQLQGLGAEHALFRGLPADRGDGRARAADAALRADETGGPDRPPDGEKASCGGSAAAGQRLGNALQHGRLSDQAEACRAGPGVPADPGAGAGRVRAAGRPAPQHLRQQPAPARPHLAHEGSAACPPGGPDHRLRGLCRERRRRAPGGALRRRRGAWRGTPAAAARDRARGAPGAHHRRCGRPRPSSR